MSDPREGVAADGTIRTGVDRSRVPAVFEPVVAALVDAVTAGLPASEAAAVGARLSERFAALCRGVEVGAAQPSDHEGDDDEAHENRVFLRHYCLLLPDPTWPPGGGRSPPTPVPRAASTATWPSTWRGGARGSRRSTGQEMGRGTWRGTSRWRRCSGGWRARRCSPSPGW